MESKGSLRRGVIDDTVQPRPVLAVPIFLSVLLSDNRDPVRFAVTAEATTVAGLCLDGQPASYPMDFQTNGREITSWEYSSVSFTLSESRNISTRGSPFFASRRGPER